MMVKGDGKRKGENAKIERPDSGSGEIKQQTSSALWLSCC